MHGTKGFLGHGVFVLHQAGDAKIGHLHRAILQNHHIVGLDIPVHQSPAVGVLQSLGNVDGKVDRLSPVETNLLFHILFEGDAIDQLHDNIIPVLCVGHIVNRHNIGMAQHGDRLTFRLEPAAEIFILQIFIF